MFVRFASWVEKMRVGISKSSSQGLHYCPIPTRFYATIVQTLCFFVTPCSTTTGRPKSKANKDDLKKRNCETLGTNLLRTTGQTMQALDVWPCVWLHAWQGTRARHMGKGCKFTLHKRNFWQKRTCSSGPWQLKM